MITFSILIRIFWMHASNLLPEEAYYWNYAKHLDFGYLDHPPMVAFLIYFSTKWGHQEWFVRLGSFFCWLFTAFFIKRLTDLIKPGSGIYALLLLAVLPFFFITGLIITPDAPLMVCWSGTVYALYRALVLNESKSWYSVGIWVGLGMLSKYTIVLLAPAVLIYLIVSPHSRYWFTRKEPYLCLLIALILFMPVIYWNALHHWVSFVFQSTQRFNSEHYFALHEYLMFLLVFLTPLGVLGFIHLFKKNSELGIIDHSQFFLQIFTLVPLLFFGWVSLKHEIKLNWIGPGLLTMIPWLALLMHQNHKQRICWFMTSAILLVAYSAVMATILFGNSNILNKKIFKQFIGWQHLSLQFNSIAENLASNLHVTPVLVPLGLYNLNSELAYYQKKLFEQGMIKKIYPIEGRHIFGSNNLMYQYWGQKKSFFGKPLILISNQLEDFVRIPMGIHLFKVTPLQQVWAYAPNNKLKVKPYYYQVVVNYF